MTGKHSADILGHKMSSLFVGSTAFDRWLASRAVGDEKEPLEAQVAASPQVSSAAWLRIEKHMITSDQGSDLGMMFSCANVTEERNLRRELARVQRLESLSLFAAGVAHDFNNLLMAIFAGLDLDSAKGASNPERDENRAMARAAFERARDLTRRLLSFAKRGTSERRPTDLRQLLNESIALSLSGSAIQCEKHYCESPAIAEVDPGQMAQVLSNILVNARQAMDDRGTISASVAHVDLPGQDGEGPIPHLRLSIADGGPGIGPDILPEIFEPYFTTKKEGTGLGLAISHAIVTEHSGQISVTSRPGAGATFNIVIPAARGDRVAAAETGSDAMDVRSGRILVMDDEVSIQSLLQHGLSRVGYSVVVVGNGEQALLEFQRAKTEKHPFDLCLLDITVRGGMGGVETLAELQRLDPGVLAIATTGYAAESASPNLQARGFAHVMAKPFLLHEILAIIKAVLP
jgi:signal transduction histidine kinase/CheY-like chemotaxis protein